MSYTSKKNLASVIGGAVLIAAYIIYVLSGNAPASNDLKAWAVVMFIFIGIGVLAAVVIQVVFHVIFAAGIAAREQEREGTKIDRIIASSMVEDEREKLIGMKSLRVGYTVAGMSFIASLAALALGISSSVSLNIIFIGFAMGSISEGVISIYYSEKGICND